MKILTIIVAFALSEAVEGIFWAAAVRGIEPIILSFGAAFAALGLDAHSNHDKQPLMQRKDLKGWFDMLDPKVLWGDNNVSDKRSSKVTEELKLKAMIEAEILVAG